jgi:hypothetical protein
MKKLAILVLLAGLMSPIQPAEALGCASAQKTLKNGISKWSFSDSKGVSTYLELNRIVLTNPKCFPSKEVKDFKKSVTDFVKQCNDPKDREMSEDVFGKANWMQFCKGMKNLVKYTK